MHNKSNTELCYTFHSSDSFIYRKNDYKIEFLSFYVEFVREERKSSRVEVPKIVPLLFVCGKKAEREKKIERIS